MDPAVATVEAYLRVNGFLTVTQYPILHQGPTGTREVTDIDVLAYRLPDAGQVLPRNPRMQGQRMHPDALLGLEPGTAEAMLVEVKAGAGRIHASLASKGVLHEALRRFGITPPDDIAPTLAALRSTGVARLPDGGRLRLVVCSSRVAEGGTPHLHIPMGHILAFLDAYLDAHWSVHRVTPFRDDVLGMLSLQRKAREALEAAGQDASQP